MSSFISVPAASSSAVPQPEQHSEPPSLKEDGQNQDQIRKEWKKHIPKPKLRLHADELRHPAVSSFFVFIPDLASTLDIALWNIVKYLYTVPEYNSPTGESGKHFKRPYFHPSIPGTRSVTVFLRNFDGVAYTLGTELDNDHKEIHLSLPYIKHCMDSAASADPVCELTGVLTHELVHCYQHTSPPRNDGKETKDIPNPPGGLIEGIADFVRLKADLSPPHWKRPTSSNEREKKWDAGYQHTAYFLAWIEGEWAGEGAIGMLNDQLLRVGYEDGDGEHGKGVGFWRGLFGVTVDELWDEYGKYLDGYEDDEKKTKGNWEEEIVNP
ncbi:hypothetical protein N7462_005597 [Penicillium macrosclerotiorum]|uniref:uncharacterized protein n=1 Tax=Penicillium macrosclerotiorum TaxID=303699 RepID=UPI0025476473|nr:uncharacterized protein N7462_005597 [Penicillium macrosclerotiorum]KAJ5682432.1 hypothetical protein N7462_005597 [Penicillium macrosclerotiorum]